MSASPSPRNPQIEEAIRELKRRARCRESLHSFAMNIEIPTVIYGDSGPLCPDEDLMGPARAYMALHHALILDLLQRTIDKPGGFGRCMIFAPPGAAKSMYTSVITPAWVMGRSPKTRLILASYGGKIAEKQSKRVQDICRQQAYRDMWYEEPRLKTEAVGDWSLSNGSEFMALGLTGGITGNRAAGLIIDDPIAGREEADSEAERQNILDAYTDDAKTRLLEGAWIAFIMTRWNEQDLAGSILPDDYDGRSGMVMCKDGMEWEILNLEAKCERHDDPLGRKIGEYIWPEFYSPKHWQQFEFANGPEASRVWSSLYQQRPTPQGTGRLTMEALVATLYKEGEQPLRLGKIGAGDYAVTKGKNDFTELGVFGMDANGCLWERDWYSKQIDSGEAAIETLNMISKHRLYCWYNEGGVIDKAMAPLLNLEMRLRVRGGPDPRNPEIIRPPDRTCIADFRTVPSTADKIAKVAAFVGLVLNGLVRFRDNANSRRIFGQLIAGAAGRHDDAHDVCGLVGRVVNLFPMAVEPPPPPPEDIKPFTLAWLEYEEPDRSKEVCYR